MIQKKTAISQIALRGAKPLVSGCARRPYLLVDGKLQHICVYHKWLKDMNIPLDTPVFLCEQNGHKSIRNLAIFINNNVPLHKRQQAFDSLPTAEQCLVDTGVNKLGKDLADVRAIANSEAASSSTSRMIQMPL